MQIIKYDFLPQAARRIRSEVFLDEQKFTVEFDNTDKGCTHLVMFDGNAAVAVCRYFFSTEHNCYMIGRVAVSKEHRGRQLGALIMKEAEKLIRQEGGKKIAVSAQCRVSGFYESLGFEKTSDEYLDEYCPHVLMTKILSI